MSAPARTIRVTLAESPPSYSWTVGRGRIQPAGVDLGAIATDPEWLPFDGGVLAGVKQIPRGLSTSGQPVNQLGDGGVYTERTAIGDYRALEPAISPVVNAGPWYLAWVAFARHSLEGLNTDALFATFSDDAPDFGFVPNARSARWRDIVLPAARKDIAASVVDGKDTTDVTLRAIEVADAPAASVLWGTVGYASTTLWPQAFRSDIDGQTIRIAAPWTRSDRRVWAERLRDDEAQTPLAGLRGTVSRRVSNFRMRDLAAAKAGWALKEGDSWRLITNIARPGDGWMEVTAG